MSKETSVGKRIQTYRTKLDMSVYDLAQKSGIDEKVINSIEKGPRRRRAERNSLCGIRIP